MKKAMIALITLFMTANLVCACTNQQMGTVGGAAIGGVAGYGLTGGSGVGAAVGAVGGGIVGNAVSR